jgi:hypothetical protein
MGLGKWLYRMLDRGELAPKDPSSPVEVANLRLTDAPLWVARLDQEGILAYYVESYDVATEIRGRARLFVRQGDASQARAILEG